MKEIGQIIQVNDIKTCTNDNCNLNSFKWIAFPGIVQKFKVCHAHRRARWQTAFCIAKVQGRVTPIERLYAPDHDFSAVFNQNGEYYNNDHMQISIHGESEQYYKNFCVERSCCQSVSKQL